MTNTLNEQHLLQKFQEIMPNGEMKQMQLQQRFSSVLVKLQNLEQKTKSLIIDSNGHNIDLTNITNTHKQLEKYINPTEIAKVQKELEKILTWKQNLQCVQNWERHRENEHNHYHNQQLNQCQQEWMQEMCQHKWIKTLLLETHPTIEYELLRHKFLLLLLMTHFVSFARKRNQNLYSNCQLFSDDQKYENENKNREEEKNQQYCDKVLNLCQSEKTQKLCLLCTDLGANYNVG